MERDEIHHKFAAEAVALTIPVVGIPLFLLTIGYLDYWMRTLFYGVPPGAAIPAENIQLWEPLFAIGVLIAMLIIWTAGLTLTWRLVQERTYAALT